MTYKYLTLATAAVALMANGAAHAETQKSQNEIRAEAATTGNMAADAEKAMKQVKKDMKEAGEKIEAFFIPEDQKQKVSEVTYDVVSSASGMIGSPVHNSNNEEVGRLHDIIIDVNGDATYAIIADNDIPGFEGKLVAIPYDKVFQKVATGDIIVPLTEASIRDARSFSYEPVDEVDVVVLPENHYSVDRILSSDVLDKSGDKIGSVNDIYFDDGEAESVIIGFNKVLGMGGDKVAADFGPTTLSQKGENLNVALSDHQSTAFQAYKASKTN